MAFSPRPGHGSRNSLMTMNMVSAIPGTDSKATDSAEEVCGPSGGLTFHLFTSEILTHIILFGHDDRMKPPFRNSTRETWTATTK